MKKYLITSFIVIIFILLSVSFFNHLIEDKMNSYVTYEVTKESKLLIREILNEEFLNSLDLENLYSIKKSDNTIEMIDFDTRKVNVILNQVNDKIIEYFDELDRGQVKLKNTLIKTSKNGSYLQVPLGIIFTNPITMSIGPSIPVKILFSNQVESSLKTDIKEYGINNVILTISIDINVCEKIIFPFDNYYIDVSLEVPIVIKLIEGKVPEYYQNSNNSDIIDNE